MDIYALPDWQQIDFISDLHLQVESPATFTAFCSYLRHTPADAVFILGDLFEVWVGDDVLSADSAFEADCAAQLHAASQRLAIFIMHGNRDFLMGPALMHACNATPVTDPCVLVTNPTRWLLTHGDALCIDDAPYMQFRAQVRTGAWQNTFLQQPLRQRLEAARHIRTQSEARKRQGETYADVDATTALQWLEKYQAQHMIHGHTHKPAHHPLDATHTRWVLSDWDWHANPPRADVLRLSLGEAARGNATPLQRLSLVEAGLNQPNLPG